MADILSVRAQIAARLGFDITDYYVIPYFELNKFLIDAFENEHLNIVEYLVKLVTRGANIHAFNNSAFRWAATNGHLSVEYLGNTWCRYTCIK